MMNLDLNITLRCNGHCLNCIKFCNRGDITGLDYSKSDMTMGQIDNFVEQVKSFPKNVVENINITGGEPLLHPNIREIVLKIEKLMKDEYIKKYTVNTNTLVRPLPQDLSDYIINYSHPRNSSRTHNVVFLHPDDFGTRKTYRDCTHYRKNTVVLNYLGCSICCAGDSYIRLFCMDDLILDYVPDSVEGFPPMDKICQHCPFGSYESLPFERDIGCPVSEIYMIEAEKNRQGREIAKRFPEMN